MPYAPRPKRVLRKRRAPARKPRSRYPKAPSRKRAPGKPTARALYAPAQPLRQVGYLPFAPVLRARLPYVESLVLSSPPTGYAGTYVFNLNSCYDPNQTSTGHQPAQWDQLTGIYKSYLVHGCLVDLEFSNPNQDGLYVGYGLNSTDTYNVQSDPLGKQVDQIGELRNCLIRPIMNTGRQKQRFRTYVPIHKLVAKPKMVFNADRASYAASVSSNPAKIANMSVIVVDRHSATTTVDVRVRLTYYVEMYDYSAQVQS